MSRFLNEVQSRNTSQYSALFSHVRFVAQFEYTSLATACQIDARKFTYWRLNETQGTRRGKRSQRVAGEAKKSRKKAEDRAGEGDISRGIAIEEENGVRKETREGQRPWIEKDEDTGAGNRGRKCKRVLVRRARRGKMKGEGKEEERRKRKKKKEEATVQVDNDREASSEKTQKERRGE